jgi:hypothetical protein
VDKRGATEERSGIEMTRFRNPGGEFTSLGCLNVASTRGGEGGLGERGKREPGIICLTDFTVGLDSGSTEENPSTDAPKDSF